MQKHTSRTVMIYAVILLGLFYIYPTIGWMILSPQERETRLATWKQEDEVYHPPDFWRDTGKGISRWLQCDRSKVINLGLDLQGGVHMVVGLDINTLTQEQREKYVGKDGSEDQLRTVLQEAALRVIQRRIHDFEAQEPIIQSLGKDQIQIQLPGEKDVERAKNLIMKTAYLTFNMVAGVDETKQVLKGINRQFEKNLSPLLQVGEGSFYEISLENIEKVQNMIAKAKAAPGLIPEGKTIAFSEPPNPWDDKQVYYIYLMDKEPAMSGEGLTRAAALPDMENPGFYQVSFEFSGTAADQFAKVTEENLKRSMAIVLDGVVVSAPVIQARIVGRGEITGRFSQEQSEDLALALTSGALPVPITEQYTGVVGASLGLDSIRRGVISSIIGFVVVVVFMAIYYTVGGVIANIALLLNVLLLLAALSYLNGTLTLPGIAGIALTMGMAVDANVLIFERVREEVRNGKSFLSSIDLGYKRATTTIIDANLTTLIAGLVLMQFGTGPIKGFAETLCLGICSSVFTALVVTHAIFDFLTKRKWLSRLVMLNMIKPDTKIPFIAQRNIAFLCSGTLIAIGMICFAIRGKGNLGVDFTNGTNMVVTVNTSERLDEAAIRSQLAGIGFPEAIVQRSSESARDLDRNQFLIRIQESTLTPPTPAAEGDQTAGESAETGAPKTAAAPPEQTTAKNEKTVSGRVLAALAPLGQAAQGKEPVTADSVQTVGPAVGKQLRNDAILALFYSFLFMLVYVWFRFEVRFGVGAIVALIHDVLITVGVFALLGRQITMPVIAALLTIVGYSINDTIVVFDRIRENLRLYRGREMEYSEIMDISINQTLSRTLLTSLTTLFVVVVLAIFGGSVIRDFALALLFGICIGTYSSIYVASALALLLQRRQPKHSAAANAKTANTRKRREKQATA